MRILYLADIRFPLDRANGIQSMATCHALAARGHDVSLAVRPDTARPPRDPFAFYGLPRLASLHVETATIGGPPAARRAGYVTFALGRALGRVRQDVIFTRDLGIASLLLRAPRLVRAPIVYEAHGLAAEEAEARPKMLAGAAPAAPAKIRRLAARDAAVWRSADAYVTITAGLRQALEERFGPRPHVAVVPDGVRAAPAGAPSARTSGTPFTIGYAGHLYPWKGVELVVECVAAIPDAHGLIIGGHPQEPDLARVTAFAGQIFCSQRITFTGMLPPAEVAGRLQDADVLLLPNPPSALSTRFTSPLKLFEYMAAGRPIVASDLPAIREVLTDGHNALLADAGNPQAYTAAVRRIKDDPALGARLAARAARDVARYTWDARAASLEALFGEIFAVISRDLLDSVRCPACRGPLEGDAAQLVCRTCGARYPGTSPDFLDLRPRERFEEQTKYLDEALHADARYQRVSPPFLGSKIRNDMLRAFLAPAPGDRLVDLGCGSGRALLWNRDWQARAVGVDIAPFFAAEARQTIDLMLGDLRRLPFADATFQKAFSLDVLEHLSPEALRGMLAEAARVLAPGGTLFVYTHVRRNARIAIGLRWINRLAQRLDRAGLIDLRQEHLRKSDHLNPLADIPELHRVAAACGFRVARIRYYTPIVGGMVENVAMRLAEKWLAEGAKGARGARGAKRAGAKGAGGAQGALISDEEALRAARAEGKRLVAESASTRAVLRVLTAAMKLDLLLFGRIESGPFFALLERVPPSSADPAGGA